MPFPNYPDKHTLPALLNSEDIIGYRRHLKRLPDVGSPAGLLLCLERGLPKRLRRHIPVRKAGSMLGEL